MISYPFHPRGVYPGGVSVQKSRVTVTGSLTGHPVATADLPKGVLPGDLYRTGQLFDLFPTISWYVAQPWEGEVKLSLVRMDRERQVDGTATFQIGGGAVDGPYSWTAEVVYSERGPIWEIDAPLPMQDGIFNDIGLRLNLSGLIHHFIGGFPAAGRPGESKVFNLHNRFTKEDFTREQPYRITRLSVVEMTKLWGVYTIELLREIQ